MTHHPTLLALVREEIAACRPLRDLSGVQPEDHLFDDLGLDSLDRTTIAIGLEERLHVDLPDVAIARWQHVSDIVACLAALRETVR